MMAFRPQISLADLPDSSQRTMDLLDSTWHRTHGKTRDLPTPQDVRSQSPQFASRFLARFEDMGLIVKGGVDVFIEEAINLWTIRKVFQGNVPVPEIYSWRVLEEEGKRREVFIYMQLVQGATIEQRWDTLSSQDKRNISMQLRSIISCLRTLQDAEPEQVIGSLCHGPAPDRCLKYLPLLQAFPSRKALQDWLSWLWRRHTPDPYSIEDPYRHLLPDEGSIMFTHGDLHPSNIIVNTADPARIIAIVDWEQAGWYPDYWEYCKACYTVESGREWHACIDFFLDPQLEPLQAFDFYTFAVGAV